jgi:NAD(P)H-hydrate epimerase
LPEIARLVGKSDAVLLGPGLGNAPATLQFAREVAKLAALNEKSLVLDADALVALGKEPEILRRKSVLATPHHREFRDLTGKALPEDAKAAARTAQAQAKRLGATLLVKGPTDIITDGPQLRFNDVHHPWMTVGGTGDVLAGLCAGLVAKGLSPFEGACAAAFLNGAAGLGAFEEKSWGARASDILEEIPRVLRDWVS